MRQPTVETEYALVDKFEDDRRRLGLRIPHDVEQADDVRSAGQVLQDLDLTLDLLLLDRLQYFDDALVVRSLCA